MNKKLVVVILLLGLVGGGAYYQFVFNKSRNPGCKGVYSEKLENCEAHVCDLTFGRIVVEKRIVGIEGSKCVTSDEMLGAPDGVRLLCKLNDSERTATVAYFRDYDARSTKGKTYQVNGKEVDNPMSSYINACGTTEPK